MISQKNDELKKYSTDFSVQPEKQVNILWPRVSHITFILLLNRHRMYEIYMNCFLQLKTTLLPGIRPGFNSLSHE